MFLCTLTGLGQSWIVLSVNKYDNTTASRWQQVPVLINDESFISNNLFKTADSIEMKEVSPSEWTVDSLAHLIHSLNETPCCYALLYKTKSTFVLAALCSRVMLLHQIIHFSYLLYFIFNYDLLGGILF